MDDERGGTDAGSGDERPDVGGAWADDASDHGPGEAGEAPAPGGAAGEAPAPGDATAEIPPVYAGPAVPGEPFAATWEPVMPLSMPPFAPVETSAGGAGPPPAPPSGWYPPFIAVPPPPPPPREVRRVVAVVAAAALIAGGLGAGLGMAFGASSGSISSNSGPVPVVPTPGRSSQASSGPSESTAAIAKAVEPAIVDINTDIASESASGQEQAAGTGMLITSSGEILTNNHVVEDATKITVSLQGGSGTYAASVIGVNKLRDVALLQLQNHSGPLPTVTLGDSRTVAVGNPVVAMGNAQGLGGQPTTVTGIVSALGRSITASDSSPTARSELLHGLIETDAPIQPGDSGGPLINGRAQVIGMDTAASSSSDSGSTLGFAIPINSARAIVQDMEKGRAVGGIVLGESPFLGIFEQPGSTVFGGVGSASGSGVAGVTISDVAIGGPAQAAGLVGGDTITKIGATATTTFAALQRAVSAEKAGNQVAVTYVDTTGATHTSTLTLSGIPQ